MKKALKVFLAILVMLVIGAVVASVIYWTAITVFHATIDRDCLIVNIMTDAIVFCAFPLIYLYIKRRNIIKEVNTGINKIICSVAKIALSFAIFATSHSITFRVFQTHVPIIPGFPLSPPSDVLV